MFFPIEEFKLMINKVLDRDGAEALTEQNPFGYEKLRNPFLQDEFEIF